MPPSLLLISRLGLLLTGVVSLPLPPEPLLSAIVTVLLIVVPGAIGLLTVTAKLAVPLTPTARLPTVAVQTVPAGLPLAQLHTVGALEAALKVVLAGTVSVMVTPERATLPVLV